MTSISDMPENPLPEKPSSSAVPAAGRLLGFDYGTKRLGVAVCNPEQTIASPVENYTRGSLDQDNRFVKRMVADYRPVGVVVGLPVHMSGDEGGKAKEARAFGAWLAEVTGLPVAFADERYSSAIAEQHLMAADFSRKKRKGRLDMLAAQVVLQNFLESDDRQAPPQPL